MTQGGPQFPDPLGIREANRPGARSHKAGLTLEQRIQALEQGALGRPGPGVDDGSTVISDSSQTGGVKWQYPHYFHLYQSAATSTFAATTAYQSIAWTAESYDSANVFTPGASATTYTVPATGLWELGMCVQLVNGAYGATCITFAARFLINGSSAWAATTNTHVGIGAPSVATHGFVYLTSGQTVAAQFSRSDGFAPTTVGSSPDGTRFYGRFLGP